jgi:hypothetical protein
VDVADRGDANGGAAFGHCSNLRAPEKQDACRANPRAHLFTTDADFAKLAGLGGAQLY